METNFDHEAALEIVHFQNACKTTNNRYFSCAIDCFLELSYRVFLPELLSKANFCDLSGFFNTMFMAGMTEIEYDHDIDFRTNALNLLHEIREPIWRKVMENCNSFQLRNSDAQFSEIFSSNFFKILSQQEKQIFQSEVSAKGVCSKCHIEKELNSPVLVNYISEAEYPELLLNESGWPKAINIMGEGSGVCDSCYEIIPNYSRVNLAHHVFVEFSSELVNKCSFLEVIRVKDCCYKLVALVRNSTANFTFAILSGNEWNYFDDCKKDRFIFGTLSEP